MKASTEQFLLDLKAHGIQVWLEGDSLRAGASGAAADPALIDALRVRKPEVIAFLQSARREFRASLPPLLPRSDGERSPLSFGQHRLWLFNELGKEFAAPFDTLMMPLRITGRLDVEALSDSLTEIIRRHEILRTTFVFADDDVSQVIHPPAPARIDEVDLSACGEQEREDRSRALLTAARNFLFDLERGPLFRARLIRMAEREHILAIMVHHIVFDGWSMSVLFKELGVLYETFTGAETHPLPALTVQYSDYAVWQRSWLQGDLLEALLVYWRQQLTGLPALELHTDRPRPRVQRFSGASLSLPVEESLAAGLSALSRDRGVTLFTTALAGLAALLHRYTGQTDIGIGTPVTDRDRTELQNLIGFFLNTLVVRLNVADDPRFTTLLSQTQRTLLDAFAHQHMSFDRLVEELEHSRDPSRSPLFQVSFAMHGAPDPSPRGIEGLDINPIPLRGQTTRFDLEIYLWEGQSSLAINIVYSTSLFDADTIGRMAQHYMRLLESIVESPNSRLSELSMLSSTERDAILNVWNKTATEYPRDRCVHELFEARAAHAPAAVAVRYGDAALSYGELDAAANRLARYLQARGAGPGVSVAFYAERGPEMIVALLAILKTGSAYLPLDLEYPASRLAFMLEDATVPLLVTHSSLVERLPSFNGTVVEIDRERTRIDQEDPAPRRSPADPEDLAYVIYTSGSTGRPKGVTVTHRGIVRLVCATDYFQIDAADRVAQASNVSFDAATFEIWGALLNGAELRGVDKSVQLDPAALAAYLRQTEITAMFVTTALFNLVAREMPTAFEGLRGLLFGGERVDANAVRAIHASGAPQTLLHVYGPTECTTFATAHNIREIAPEDDNVPIGRPIANTTAYILDEQLQPVPVGVPGELYLGGDGLAAGYLKRPELTAEKFISSPFDSARETRLYRTGDRACYRADGAIEFIERLDNQVKIRGFRIELGEIESALGELPQVAESMVLIREEAAERRLVAYVVPSTGETIAIEDLRARLKERLPAYMVPSLFIALDAFPVTENGKVDRAALIALQDEPQERSAISVPRSELEQSIAAVWREVLNVEEVGIRDNFFDLGGHSLLLIRTHARLRATLGCELSPIDLFEHSTIEALAKFLRRDEAAGSVVDKAATRLDRRRSHLTGDAQSIAIIGMAGRFPGARDMTSFWSNLRDGVESITFFTREQLVESGVPGSALSDPDYVAARGYLEDADLFDANFFGYSAREAEIIDPQQRLLLECGSETLDRAGYDPDRYEGLVGVYAGASLSGYHLPLQRDPELAAAVGGLTRILGGGHDFLATRLSYKLNLRGPSMNVQTACSTSLVAVHEACRALADYSCDMALAGGVSATPPLKSGYLYVEDGIGSRDGHCRAFDAAAGGCGVAMVLLKRLDEALADGDHVHAVILGTAANNDGSNKVGYTAPSVEGQAEVIAMAQAAARCPADTIDYVEAHGTGTRLGDPIEVAALTQAFGKQPDREQRCWLGSLKSNVGHLDAAAGVAALVKTALSLEHKQIAPSLNYRQPNPEINFENGPFQVNTELRPWPSRPGSARRAGVSSFGLGGTNAHAVLEEAPPCPPAAPARAWQVLCLAARSSSALDTAAAELADHFEAYPQTNLADAAYTLQLGRGEYSHRRIVVCRDTQEAVAKLRGEVKSSHDSARCKPGARAVVFMFTGQGAQYAGMGKGLYDADATFRAVIDECSESLQADLDLDLREVLYPHDHRRAEADRRLQRTELAQPALFATEMALARWWIAAGVQPEAMIGHSIGEYTAACLAGVMTLEEALHLVAERGRLMGSAAEGCMMAVPMAPAALDAMLPAPLSIATINQPELCVVSGPGSDIAAFEDELASTGVEARRLRTSHAFHSSMMEPVQAAFAERVASVALQAPQLPYVSNVSGDWITAEQATDPEYYAAHLREAVQYSGGLETLFRDPDRVFVEVGPGHTLAALVSGHPERSDSHVAIASTPHRHGEHDEEAFLARSLGRLWLAGKRPDWRALHAPHARRRVILPSYPFERQRYWLGTPAGQARPTGPKRHTDPLQWTYVPSWKRLAAPTPNTLANGGVWLCFRDELGITSALEKRLRAAGSRVCAVLPGSRFEQVEPGVYTVAPGCPDDYDELLRDLADNGAIPRYVLHAWSLYPDIDLPDDETSREARRMRGFYSLVALTRAALAVMDTASLGIAVLTSQVREVDGSERLCPDTALVAGVLKVIGMEHANVRCRHIDVVVGKDGAGLPQLARALAADVLGEWTAPVVAYRGQFRWAQAFERLGLGAQDGGNPLRDNGVYLITGGLGDIGLELASYLASAAHAKLVLVGRSGLPPRVQWESQLAAGDDDATSRRIRRILEMERAGAAVMIVQADVANAAQMEAAIDAAETQFGPLAGVVHAAGAEKRLTPLSSLERTHCEAQFGPRVHGLPVLARVLSDRKLDFVAVTSSLASVLGIVDFAAYTAAHVYMDTFVLKHSRETDTPWLTINWDGWNTLDETGANTRGRPSFPLRAAEGVEVFARLLAHTTARQVLVSTGDLAARLQQWDRAGEGADHNGGAEPDVTARDAHPRPDLSSDYAEPRNETERVLAAIWREVLGIDAVGIHDNFFELGGDSVLNFQITARAAQKDIRLTQKQLFEYQTIAELAAVASTAAPPAAEDDGGGGPAPAPVADRTANGISTGDLAEILEQQGH